MRNEKSELVVKKNSRLLTAAEFQSLADVPPEVEWFVNQKRKHNASIQNRRAVLLRLAGQKLQQFDNIAFGQSFEESWRHQ